MKVRFLALVLPALLFALSLSLPASAQDGGFQGGRPQAPSPGGGFVGPGSSSVTVEQARQMRDDTPVVLSGRIVRSLGKDKYVFADSTADIVVEIDHDEWGGVNATPDTDVVLYGEVDRDWNAIEIDVDRVELKT
jgi:uncharacterized protein (TIGR00156 family)